MPTFRLERLGDPAHLGEARRDRGGATGEEPVGAAHHGILLMDDRLHPGERGTEHRRHSRITAEADQNRRFHPFDDGARCESAFREFQDGAGHLQRRTARRRRRRHGMHRLCGEMAGILGRPRVGHQHDANAARMKRMAQRLGGEEMAAGPPGGQHHERAFCHDAGLSACSRNRPRGAACASGPAGTRSRSPARSATSRHRR